MERRSSRRAVNGRGSEFEARAGRGDRQAKIKGAKPHEQGGRT